MTHSHVLCNVSKMLIKLQKTHSIKLEPFIATASAKLNTIFLSKNRKQRNKKGGNG